MAEIMNDSDSISVIKQNDPDIPEYLDFEILRREGLEHIGNLSGKIWTDHNVHDPGITILEVLVYALMDLGYKTNLPFQDLITPQNNTNEEDNFLTPLEALTINPVTITDYRKLLLEVKGVRNAWLEPAQEQGLLLDSQSQKLFCGGIFGERGNANTEKRRYGYQEIDLNGLYQVYIEEDSEVVNANLEDDVLSILAEHRNLCEDFVGIKTLTPYEIGVCVEAELHTGVNTEKVYVEIFETIKNYIQPKIKYYTLEELLDKGKAIDDIFAGRPYRKESFGFIDTEELESFDKREKIYLSDLYDVILSIEGVRKIKNIHIKKGIGNSNNSQDWEHTIPEDNVPVFSTEKTCIDLYNSQGVLTIDKPRIHRTFFTAKQFTMPADSLDAQLQSGNYREDLEEYYSIQNDFPVVYGIGEDGLPDRSSLLRKTQALQLKGYLMFYDQILANYTSQLAHIRSLFSLKPEDERTIEEKRTYFTQIPESVPGLDDLLRFYGQNESMSGTSLLAVPVANNMQWSNALKKLQNNAGAELTIGNYCNDKVRLIDVFSFSSTGIRAIYINQLIDSFSNENYTIEIIKDRRGYFFVIQASLPNDILLVGIKRYTTMSEARKEAKNLAFIATMSQSYSQITNSSDTELPDQHFFDITHSPLSYIDLIQGLTEDKNEYVIRRKQLLDHLLARFGEEFTDYTILQFQNQVDTEKFKEDEIDKQSKYVSKFAEVSRNRGKAFNYLEPSWNTPNVSGLEKRLVLLSGMDNYERRNLCNFEVTPSFRILLRDWSGNALFRSNTGYETKEELYNVARKIIPQLRNPEKYRLLQKSMNGFDTEVIRRIFSEKPGEDNIIITKYYYYQQLKKVEGEVAVVSKSQKMRSEKMGIEKREDFITTINEQTLVAPLQEKNEYRLLPLSIHNCYLNVNALPCDIETLITWKWHLQEKGVKEKKSSDLVFDTDNQAWEHMVKENRLDNYLTTHDVAHKWKLRLNDDISIEGLDCYPDAYKSVAAWRQAKMLGNSEKNFSVENKGESIIISLKNEKGNVIAVSNEFDSGKNDVKTVLENCVSLFGNRNTKPDYINENRKYGFQILGKDNTPVFVSYCVYDSEKEALQQIDTVFKLGENKKSYLLSGDQGNPEYNFILRDKYESFLALPPDHFETATDRTKALNAMMRYFKNSELPVYVKEEPRRYVWSLLREGRKVLNSTSEFSSKSKAQADFDKIIAQEAVKENNTICKPYLYDFSVIPMPAQYKFVYGNSDAQNKLDPVFLSTSAFRTYDQASDAYEGFMKQLPGLKLKVSPKNDQDFGLYASDSNTPIAGRYSKDKPSLSKAQNIVNYISKVYNNDLSPKENFVKQGMIENEKGLYEWRFLKKNTPLVTSPYRCDNEALTENFKSIVCDITPPVNLKECPKRSVVICPEGDPNKYHYKIEFSDDQGNEFALISYKGYNSEQEAEEAWQKEWLDIIDIATNPEEYNSSGKINIEETYFDPESRSCEKASFIAVIPKRIRDEVEAQGKDLEDYYTRLADIFPIYKVANDDESDIKYSYRVVVPQSDLVPKECENEDITNLHLGTLLWQSENYYDDSQKAIDAYQYFYSLAGVSSNCRIFCEKGKFYIGVIEVLAESSRDFQDDKLAWDDDYLTNDKDDCENCVPGGVREFIYAAEEDKNYVPVYNNDCWRFKVVSPSYFVADHSCYYNSKALRDREMNNWISWLQNLDWHQYIIWRPIEGGIPRRGTEFFSKFEYNIYLSQRLCDLVFTCRDNILKCKEREEAQIVDEVQASLKQKYQDDHAMLSLIDNPKAKYKDLQDLIKYFPVYKTDQGYRFRLYFPDNDNETTPNGLQPCGCEEETNTEKFCNEPYPFISSNYYKCCAEALNAFIEFCEIIRNESYTAECTSKTEYGPYSFQIINKEKELAYHPQQYETFQEVKDVIEITKLNVNDVGMHLLEHILLRPKSFSDCGYGDNDYGGEGEYYGEGNYNITNCLLPVCAEPECEIKWRPDQDRDDPCVDTGNPVETPYIPGSDPYSFWATVALPSWHKQFRTAEKRIAFENFLYRETPALIGLNILWLSPHDLCKFEDVFKEWLSWIKEDPSEGRCSSSNLSPNCALSDCIGDLESELPCESASEEEGDCNCDDKGRIVLPEDNIGSIFWGDCSRIIGIPQEGIVTSTVDELGVKEVKPDSKRTKETAKPVTEKPKTKTSKKRTTEKKSSKTTKKVITKKTKVKEASEDELTTIRKRKPKYLANVEALADDSMKNTKSYERVLFFLQNTPTIGEYNKLVDFFNRYSLQKDNNTKSFIELLKNATWHLLDKLVLEEKEEIKKEEIESLAKRFKALKSKGLSLKELDATWESDKLGSMASDRSLKQIKKLLK